MQPTSCINNHLQAQAYKMKRVLLNKVITQFFSVKMQTHPRLQSTRNHSHRLVWTVVCTLHLQLCWITNPHLVLRRLTNFGINQ